MPQIVSDIRKPGTKTTQENLSHKNHEKEKKQKSSKVFSRFSDSKTIIEKSNIIKKPKSLLKVFSVSVVLVLFVILAFGTYSYFFSLGAKVTIWPKKESLDIETKITADKSVKDVNIFAKTIPATLFQTEKTISQTFDSTGKTTQSSKATGTIRVYNNYSTVSQALVSNTRFISSSGKLFRTTTKLVVPGQSYDSKGKLQPGYADVKVTADQAGEDYNIEPSTFSIPGFAGTAKYTGFYGKSTEAMSGGSKGEASQITDKDINSAKELISTKLFQETKQELKGSISEEYVFVEIFVKDKTIEVKVPKAGDIGKTFDVQIKGSSEILAFKKADLDNFVAENLLFQKPVDKELYKESIKTDYSVDKIDIDNGKMILNLQITSEIFTGLDIEKIKADILGIAPLQIKDLMSTEPSIDKVEVKLLPPWARTVPQDKDKITIKLNLD